MEWLLSLAFIPILLCGLMCLVPIALAAIGLSRHATQRPASDEDAPLTERERVEAASR
jgi:hypothetical protein